MIDGGQTVAVIIINAIIVKMTVVPKNLVVVEITETNFLIEMADTEIINTGVTVTEGIQIDVVEEIHFLMDGCIPMAALIGVCVVLEED